jgi:hypothetical protein
MKDEGVPTNRDSASHEILAYATRLAATSEDMAERVESAFSPVIRERTTVCGIDSTQIPEVSREYPPLFAALQGYLASIDRALAEIQKTIDRNEL